MRHEVVDPGIEADFVHGSEALGAEVVIQRAHFRSDVGGGDEMRALGEAGLGNADMLVGGEH